MQNDEMQEYPKIITMYLPQYHEIPENNEWWGEGFTEWTTVTKARKLYAEHNQPNLPYENYYYDLLDKTTMEWQADLMKRYNVYGQCFYHYWFKNGRKVLEKPAENLLNWPDIDMPFCFSWANEPWIRSWSNIKDANVWSSKFEIKGGTEVLLEQEYGGKKEWKSHFEYLLPFFMDERYIKIDRKPIFIFYKPDVIPRISEMMDYWNTLAMENGLAGIYFIGTNTYNDEVFDARMWQESQKSRKFCNSHYVDNILCYDYDEIWMRILQNNVSVEKKMFLGGVVGYDDTPRHERRGSIIINSSPKKFQEYLAALIEKSKKRKNEYVFINAWNEWGEGMYLEPDQKNGYAYLEAVKKATTFPKISEEIKEKMIYSGNDDANVFRVAERYEIYWKLLERWMRNKRQGKTIEQYLKERGINRIAIYGMGMLGRHLFEELKESEIKVLYGIDKNARNITVDIPLYIPDEKYQEVDAIIISVVYQNESIINMLKEKTAYPILLLQDIVL